MKLDIPFNQADLAMAAESLENKFPDYDAFAEQASAYIDAEWPKMIPADAAEKNRSIAEFHGVTIEALIGSPNLEMLTGQYVNKKVTEFVERVKNNFNLDDAEAWVIVLAVWWNP
jgi:hypothetical protein